VKDRLTGSTDILLAVTSDHSTPSSTRLIHSGEPVPLMFLGKGVRRDEINAFDEVSCAGGALGLVRGSEFMHWVLNYLERAKLVGIMDTPIDQAYWPGDYEPFKAE
jgi:2,3-bisphosphoglycerate-independent phosphoglycerate mutase